MRMIFRTEIALPTATHLLDYQQQVFTTGSCFAASLGHRLQLNKFSVTNTPFGTVYNPVSIHRQILDALGGQDLAEDDFFTHQGQWRNVQYHSSFNDLNRENVSDKIRHAWQIARQSLHHADWLIITYGTAFVYELTGNGRIVANCQKLPSAWFQKRLLTPTEIVASFDELVTHLRRLRPQVNILVTLSPVRHVRDSLTLNQVSKSVVRYALHQIVEKHTRVSYFPSYEIVLDDLRDYRFYESDLIHPNQQALDYIWEKFCDAYLTAETKATLARWQSIAAELQHRAFDPDAKANKQRLEKLHQQLLHLRGVLPVENEINEIAKQINS